MERERKNVVHIYYGTPFGYKKNKILSYMTTWIELEIIVLSEIS
jgi:hypothetical protein